ncbi:MAG TPA: hypothetical protein PKN56_20455 [Leptospiraceae bacterium]|nr:hypothetical protein [Leptospiraceae bacterium]HMY66355.1 hypothetical protein [Leptospiraceae bacterium]HNF22913.1 hypothetical protein [Leptospiraceae bacterium]HNI94896.1 hypothetical protein [Leptospiraceae bacterium]HNM06722.1 hypothetical protein [Leptospiraceae bacterium]
MRTFLTAFALISILFLFPSSSEASFSYSCETTVQVLESVPEGQWLKFENMYDVRVKIKLDTENHCAITDESERFVNLRRIPLITAKSILKNPKVFIRYEYTDFDNTGEKPNFIESWTFLAIGR